MSTVHPLSPYGPGTGESNPPCCVPDCGLESYGELPLDPPIPLCSGCMKAVHDHIIATAYPKLVEYAKSQEKYRNPPPRPETRADVVGYVYFIRFGDRVKIGWTSNLWSRLPDVPHDEILLVIEGTMRVEQAQHMRFAEHRIKGEWFAWNDETRAMVVKLAEWQVKQSADAIGSLIPGRLPSEHHPTIVSMRADHGFAVAPPRSLPPRTR